MSRRRKPVSPFHSIESVASLGQRVTILEKKFDHLRDYMKKQFTLIGQVMADIELRQIYTMRAIKRNRPVHAGLIVGGRQEVEVINLQQLYEREKESFIELLKAEAGSVEDELGEATRAVEDATGRLEDASAEGRAANPDPLAYDGDTEPDSRHDSAFTSNGQVS